MSLANQIKNQHLMWRAGFGPSVEQLNDLSVATPDQFYKALQKASIKKPEYIDVADDFLKGLFMGMEEIGRQQVKEMTEEGEWQATRTSRRHPSPRVASLHPPPPPPAPLSSPATSSLLRAASQRLNRHRRASSRARIES